MIYKLLAAVYFLSRAIESRIIEARGRFTAGYKSHGRYWLEAKEKDPSAEREIIAVAIVPKHFQTLPSRAFDTL